MRVPREILAVALSVHACAALAQAGAAAQSIEVTGSRLRGVDAEGASPVQVITMDEIRRRGLTTWLDVFSQLASNSGGASDIGGNGTESSGSTSTTMRSLGFQSTLVLLNFRRVAPYPLSNGAQIFTNIDALPFEAVDRVEILKSGGAALYGSDAVAGVINIITKRDWVGVQLRASHEQSITSGKVGSSTASVTAGFGQPGADSGHVMVNLEVFRRDSLIWGDVLGYVDPALTKRSPGFGTPSSYSWPGNVIGADPLPGCAPEWIQGGLCRYDRYSRFQAMPAAERANLLVTGDLPLKDGRRLFGELLLADNRTHYISPFQPYGPALAPITWGDPANGSTQTFYYRGLPAGHPLNTTGADGAELRYRFIDGPAQEDPRTLQYRALAGLAGGWRGFDWETAAGVMGGRTTLEQRGWFSVKGFRDVIGIDDPSQPDPQFFNRAYKIGQANSPEVLAKLFPSYGYTGQVQQWFVDGRLTGALTQLPNGPLNMALGGELRRESFTVTPSAALLAGDIVGNGLTASDASRIVGGAFIELAGKVNPSTELQAAVRLDSYSHLAPHLSPKLALRYQPSPQWMLRASAETGFRAPNLTETSESTKYGSESLPDPRRCPQAVALAGDLRKAAGLLSTNDPQYSLLQARADNVTTLECQGAIASIIRNNPDLKPESSRSLNAGIVFSPNKNWRWSLDVWDIYRRNEIGLKSTTELLNAESVLPAGTINRLPLANDPSFSAAEQLKYGVTTGLLRSVVGRFDNIARTHTQGIDVLGQTHFNTPLGSIDLQADISYLTIFRRWSPSRGDWGDNVAGRSSNPRIKANYSVTLQRGAWEHTLQGVSISGVPLYGDFYDTTYNEQGCADAGFAPQDCRIAGHTTWNYGLRYSGWKQLTLSLGVSNVFGTREPKGVAGWLNAGGIFPSTLLDAKGRALRVTVEWQGS